MNKEMQQSNTLRDSIMQSLMVGEKKSITSKEISELTGADLRTVRAEIEDMRNDGVLICAGAHGYYLPEKVEDVVSWLKMAEKRAKSVFLTIRGARKYLKSVGYFLPEGQLSLSDMESILADIDDKGSE